MPKKFSVTAKVDVPSSKIVNMFISACEGGSSYWCSSVTPKGKGDPYESMLAGFTLIEIGGCKKRVVTPTKIKEGVQLMATKYPQDFADMVQGEGDAFMADTFLQLCTFRELIYG